MASINNNSDIAVILTPGNFANTSCAALCYGPRRLRIIIQYFTQTLCRKLMFILSIANRKSKFKFITTKRHEAKMAHVLWQRFHD